MVQRFLFLAMVVAIGFAISGELPAAPYLPPSVTPGSPYHLIFVTQDPRDATSTNIADYNTFVNNQAALNATPTGNDVGVIYSVVGSTATVDANANAPVSAPVYNFQGTKVADSFADLWDGSLDAPVIFDQFGLGTFPDVFTGTDSAGFGLGGFELGAATVETGLANLATADWIDNNAVGPQASLYRFYALSEPITAPGGSTSVPEPASLAIWALFGLLTTAVWRIRRL